MSILDWPTDIEDQLSSTQAEFLLLARFVDPHHPIIDRIYPQEPLDLAIAHRWFPDKFPKTVVVQQDHFGEVAYANGLTPLYDRPRGEDPRIIPHRIMWSTDFGEKPFIGNAKGAILSALEGETNPTWLAEYLMALKFIGEDVPQDKVNELVSWRDSNMPYSWANYHHHLCIELMFSVGV